MYYADHSIQFKKLLGTLKGKKVVVLGHQRPDGDCIGAQIALTRALNRINIEAVAVNADPVPSNLKNFVKDTPFLLGSEFTLQEEVVISVDCAVKNRFGKIIEDQLGEIYLNIDHHISNSKYAENNIAITHSAATCEILAGLFFDNQIEMDAITASALYAGIVTDTGQFQYESTTTQVLELAQHLIKLGAEPARISHELYSNEPIRKWMLLKEFLGTLKLELDGKVCIGVITQEMYNKTGSNKEDTEGFVDYARAVEGVDIGVLLEERPDKGVKGSLRAEEGIYRVNDLASKFNGGGHHCAAGLRTNDTLEAFYPKFVAAIEAHLEEIGK